MAMRERAYRRTGLVRPASFEIDGHKFDCVVQNISKKGAKLRLAQQVNHEASNGLLNIPDIGNFAATIAWVHGKEMGLEFQQEADFEISAEHAAADISEVLAVLNNRRTAVED